MYLPIENVDKQPVLRVIEPARQPASEDGIVTKAFWLLKGIALTGCADTPLKQAARFPGLQ